MPRIVLDNFKGGLDATRDELVADSSTLVEAVNIDITRGGEISKAGRFASRHSLPASTFGLASEGANLVVFGSAAGPTMPNGVIYQRLQHSDGSTAMSRIIWTEKFDGLIYAIAQFTDGQVFHYYDGSRITSWDSIQVAISSLAQIASNMAGLVNANSGTATATSADEVITVTGRTAGDGYLLSKSTTNASGGTNDQDITLASVTPAAVAVAETPAEGSFRLSQSSSGGSVTDVTVDGITVLAHVVGQEATITETVEAVIDIINATNDIDYTASLVGSDTVKLTANAGLGDSVNGHVVAVTVTAPVVVESTTDIGGGADAIDAVAQVDTATISGTVEDGDVYELTIDGETFTVNTAIGFVGSVARTLQDKVYSIVGSLLRFSGVATPTQWVNQTGPPLVVGAGFINMANQDSGSAQIVGLGLYQNRLAVLSRNSTQIWSVDPDPDLNAQQQVISNVGTFAPGSIVSFGDIDLFFLSDKGIRSLRVRDSSTFASVSDVGTPIDTLVTDHLATLSDNVAAMAVATIDPINGRYLLAVGGKVYAFSFFPSTKVTAWTEYDPGFTIESFVINDRAVFARAGDTIYQLGGDDGTAYADGAEVIFPWIDANSVGTWKNWQGIDVICTGKWSLYAATAPEAPDSYELIATISGTTIGKRRVPFMSHSPTAKFKMVNTGTEAGTISTVAAMFRAAEDD